MSVGMSLNAEGSILVYTIGYAYFNLHHLSYVNMSKRPDFTEW